VLGLRTQWRWTCIGGLYRFAVGSGGLQIDEPWQVDNNLLRRGGKGCIQAQYCLACRRLIEGKRESAEVGRGLTHGDPFARADPHRGDDREQVELVPVFADQHGAQKSPVLGGKPSVRREIVFKVATAPRVNIELESGVG
jgi:hypothetical protein